MVTISSSHSPVAARSNTPVSEVFCLSCDTLPTDLGNGSEAFEIDTGTKYYLDATAGDPMWYDTSGNARTVTALTSPTVAKEAQTTKLFEVAVSKMQQNDISVSDSAITGTVKWLSEDNAITSVWGEGNFLCLKFTSLDSKATSVKVGLEPSMGSGLAEIIDDPDKNGIFKITDKDTQKLVVVSSRGPDAVTKVEYSLSGLTLQTAS